MKEKIKSGLDGKLAQCLRLTKDEFNIKSLEQYELWKDKY
jgi:hypothetical protein